MFHELPPTAGLPPRLRDLFALAGSTDLEKALAGFLGVPEAQLECSGSACLVIALEFLKTRSERRTVIVPGYTCPLVVIAARQAGCRVVACDLVPGGFDLDIHHLKALLGPDTLCVVATHYGGALTDVERVRDAAKAHSQEIAVIEDAAQAFGARFDERPAGLKGDIGFYSFAAGKGLTLWEGGCLVAQESDVRAGLRETSKRLVKPDWRREAWRAFQLFCYHFLYNPLGLALAYGVPRRFWLWQGSPEKAIGEDYADHIPLHPVGRFRRRIGVQALKRIAAHVAGARKRRLSLVELVGQPPSKVRPYQGPGESSGLFLFAMTRTPAELDVILSKAWPASFGVTKLFVHAIGDYASLAGLLEPSETPNARHLAATTLTITTSAFMTGPDRLAMIAML